MALPDLTGQNIENTYQRILQTDGTNFYDGTGSAVSIGGSQNLQQVTEQGAVTTIPITASIISASSNIFTNNATITTQLTAANIAYPTADGDNGDVLVTDGAGNLSFTRTVVYANVKNVSGATLAKGWPVHATASAGNASEVIAASASNADTMPATYILAQELNNEEEGLAILTGYINGVNTSQFEEGQVLYVGADGGYTNIKPTGSNLIQNLGIVAKSAENGSGYVYGSGRSNDIPNISPGYVWVGNSDSVATAVATSSFVVGNANTASYVASSNIDGTIDISDQTNLAGGTNLTLSGDTMNLNADINLTSITASVISASGDIIGGGLDVNGPENSHIEVGTHIVGFDQFSFDTALITGSGLIISGTMADQNHHNFLKIGDIELVDVKTAFSPNTFLIHNVDDFAITSGSDGGNITTANLLFRHQGDTFDIYQNGVSKINANATGLTFSANSITFTPGTGDTNIQAGNTTATNTYIITAEQNPNSAPKALRSINAQDFFRTVNGAVTASVVSASGDIIANSITASIHGGTF